MTEQDVFERRLRTALRRRVADGPTEFDALGFARAVAAKEPRHGFAATLGWRRVAIPRGTWVLLLLAGLLTAIVAGMLVVGWQPIRKLEAVLPPVGPAFACPPDSTPDKPGSVDQARPPISYVAPMAFDRRAGRIVLLAEGYATPGPETWTFDVCTDTWTRMYPAREPTGGGHLVYDVDADLTIAIDAFGGAVWAYDLEANTWTAKAAVPLSLRRQPGVAYDSASGLVLVLASTTDVESEPSELWAYDAADDRWSHIQQIGAPDVERAHQGVLAYDPSVDRLISYLPSENPTDRTRLFDFRTGTWSTPGAAAPHVMFGYGPSGGEIAYDESAQRMTVFSYGRVMAYDAPADRWEILVAGFDPGETMDGLNGPTVRWMPSMVYDPVNLRLVVYGGHYPTTSQDAVTWVQADDVLAFDPATREWSVLLEARNVSTSPS